MSTIINMDIVCEACGHSFGQTTLSSISIIDPPDLDTRPGEMLRSYLDIFVKRCPSCNYCSRDLSKFDDRFREVMESSEYKSQLEDTTYPELASSFICNGMLADSAENLSEAGFAYLHAAWVLDDADNDPLARVWRSKAADRFLKLLSEGEIFAKTPGTSEAITIDCLRRAGRGDEALRLIEQASNQNYNDQQQNIFSFQKELIKSGDTSRHILSEVIE